MPKKSEWHYKAKTQEGRKSIGVRLSKAKMETFKNVSEKNGTNRYALITKWVDEYLEGKRS